MFVIAYDNKWKKSQRNATALLFSFGHALALAKQLYGVIIHSTLWFLICTIEYITPFVSL